MIRKNLTICFTVFALLVFIRSNAQTSVQIGVSTRVLNAGNALQVVMENGTLVNNGTYQASAGTFKGNGVVALSGSGTTTFYNTDFGNAAGTSTFSSLVSVLNQFKLSTGSFNAGTPAKVSLDTNAIVINNGILSGNFIGLKTKASVSTGTVPYNSVLSHNVSGTSMQYQWQSSTNNSIWVNEPSATNETYTVSVSAPIYYRCVLSTSNSSYSQATPAMLLDYAVAPPAPPTITNTIANQAICDGDTISNLAITLSDADVNSVTLSATDTSAGINPTYIFNGTGANRTLRIITVNGQIGATSVNVIATNNYGMKDTLTFLLELGNSVPGSSLFGAEEVVISPFNNLKSFAFGTDNKLYVCVGNSPGGAMVANSIAQFSATGTLLNSSYITGLNNPSHLHIASNGRFYFSQSSVNLSRYNAQAFEATRAFAATSLSSIVTDASGDVFYLDAGASGSVLKLPGNFTPLELPTTVYSALNLPSNMIIDPSGNTLYYVQGNKVMKANVDGSGQIELLTTPTIFGISFDENGQLWMQHNFKLSKVGTGTGAFTEVISSWPPSSELVFKNGYIYYGVASGSSIGIYRRTFTSSPNSYTACSISPVISPSTATNDTVCASTSAQSLPSRSFSVIATGGNVLSSVVTSSVPALLSVSNVGTADSVVLDLNVNVNQSGTATVTLVSTSNTGDMDTVYFDVVVKPFPSSPSVSPSNIAINPGQYVQFTGSGNGGTLKWYDGATNSLLASGTSFISPVIQVATTYTLRESVQGCESTGATATVTIKSVATFGGRRAN